MNKNRYRIIFSHARGMFIAVAEIVKSKTKQAGQSQGMMEIDSVTSSVRLIHYKKLNPLNFAVIGCLGALVISLPMSSVAETQIIADKGAPTSQQPTILNSANGTTQINIQTPSAGGVSRNTYTQFDVGQEGAILNNSRNNTQTQIGGWVQGNPWLATGEAKVILNEVNSSNPSQLKGYIEVAGKQAQVVIANPSGLICDGCGVINADRFTLTTGQAVMNQGYLESFRVREGQVTIEGKGLNGSLTPYTDIYARALKVNAGLYANELNTVLGQNDIQVKDQIVPQIKAIKDSTSTPQPNFALDVGQLGGMYAGKIFLVGTEQGLGVRNAGTINSTQSTLTLNANGDLINNGNLIANKDQVQLKAQNIQNTGNVSSATSQISIESQSLDNSGLISSADELQLNQQNSLSNSGTLNAARVVIDAGSLKNSGSIEQTGLQGLDLKSGSMTNLGGKIGIAKNTTGGGTGGSTGGSVPTVPTDPSKDGGSLEVATPIDTTPKTYDQGYIHVQEQLNNDQGAIIANGGVDLDSQNGLDNQGGQLNLGAIHIKGNSFNNNQGELTVKSADIQTSSFSNQQGLLQSLTSLDVNSQSIDNQGGKINALNNISIISSGNILNQAGQIASSSELYLQGLGLNNSGGDLEAEQLLKLNLSGHLNNQKGKIVTNNNLDSSLFGLDNDQGEISAKNITIQNNDQALSNGSGTIYADQSLKIQTGSLNNAVNGTLSSHENLQIDSQQLVNQGYIRADQQLKINNTGVMTQQGGVLSAYGNIDLVSQRLVSDEKSVIAVGINAQGEQDQNAQADLNIKTEQALEHHGKLLASRNIDLDGANVDLSQGTAAAQNINITARDGDINNQSGVLQADSIQLNAVQNQQSLINQSGQILAKKLNLNIGKDINNQQGLIQHTATDDLNLTVQGIINNQQGRILTNANQLNIKAQGLNSDSGVILHSGQAGLNMDIQNIHAQKAELRTNGALKLTTDQALLDQSKVSATQANIQANQLTDRNGEMLFSAANGQSSIRVNGDYQHQGSVLQSNHSLDIQTDSLSNQSGNILVTQNEATSQPVQLNIVSQNDIQNDLGNIVSEGQLSLKTGKGISNQQGNIISSNALELKTDQLINNQSGQIQAKDIKLSASNLDNSSGVIAAKTGDVSLNINNQLINGRVEQAKSAGIIQAAQNIDVQTGLLDNSGLIYAGQNQQLKVAQNLKNAGQLAAQNNLNIQTATLTQTSAGSIIAGLTSDGSLANQGNLNIDATGAINAQGQLIAGGDLNSQAASHVLNQSLVQAKNISLNSKSGQLSAQQSTIQAAQQLNIVTPDTLDTQQANLKANKVQINAKDLNNQSGHIQQTGLDDTQILLTGDLSNQNGQIDSLGQKLQINANNLNNQNGLIQSGTAGSQLILAIANTLNNNQGNIKTAGSLQTNSSELNNDAGTLLSFNGFNINTQQLSNQAGQIVEAGTQDNIVNQLIVKNLLNNSNGKIQTNHNLEIQADALKNNAGSIVTAGAAGLNLNTTSRLDNQSGNIRSSGDLNVNAQDILNDQGQILAAKNAQLNSQNTLSNQAGLIAAQQQLMIQSAALNNQAGQIGSVDAGVNIQTTQQALNNQSGKIQANQAINLDVQGLDNSLQGLISSTKGDQSKIQIDTHQQNLNNQNGQINSGNTLQISTNGVNNQQGLITAQGDLGINAVQLIDNRQTYLNATLPELAQGIQSLGQVVLQTSELNNEQGQVIAGNGLTIQAPKVNNSNAGLLASGRDLLIDSVGQAGTINNQKGKISANQNISLNTGLMSGSQLDNSQQGFISAAKQVKIISQNIDNSNNDQNQGIQAGQIEIAASTLNNSAGRISAEQQLNLNILDNLNNTKGLISSLDQLTIQGQQDNNRLIVNNQQGTIIAGEEGSSTAGLNILAKGLTGDGKVLSQGQLNLQLNDDYVQDAQGQLQAQGNLNLSSKGKVTNHGAIKSNGQLSISANTIENAVDGSLESQQTQLESVGVLNNYGLINGSNTYVKAGQLNNIAGRIYGDHIAIQANTLNNQSLKGLAPVIASRGDLDLGVQVLNNLENNLNHQSGSQIIAMGDLRIGGSLDSQWHAQGTAQQVNNRSSVINANGNIDLNADIVNNQNVFFTTKQQQTTEQLDYWNMYISDSRAGWYNPGPQSLITQEIYSQNPDLFTKLKPAQQLVTSYDNATMQDYLSRPDGYFFIVNNYDDSSAGNMFKGYVVYNGQLYSTDHYENVKSTQTTTTTVADESAPAVISAGGNLSFTGTINNDKSQIMVGQKLIGDANAIHNVDAKGPKITHEEGTVTPSYGSYGGKGHDRVWASAEQAYNPADVTKGVDLFIYENPTSATPVKVQDQTQQVNKDNLTEQALSQNHDSNIVGQQNTQVNQTETVQQTTAQTDRIQSNEIKTGQAQLERVVGANTTDHKAMSSSAVDQIQNTDTKAASVQGQTTQIDGSGFEIRTNNANVKVPNNALYSKNPDSRANYLVETDPAFSNYRNWLSSDYMLNALGLDPALQQKRLGDGYYEQRMVQDQVAQLTGYRFLQGYGSDEEQYKALMNNGLSYAKQYNLRPGIALTPEQMAQLSSDIVWLVEKETTLLDGTKTKALVPQVYVKARVGDLKGDGTLISADSIQLNLSKDLTNAGTIAGRQVVQINSQNLNNLAGNIRGGVVSISTEKDLNNIGGMIQADQAMNLQVKGNLNIQSTTQSSQNALGQSNYSWTGIDRIAGLYIGSAQQQALSDQPTLVMNVGGDTRILAANIQNNSGGRSIIRTGGDLKVGSLNTEVTNNVVGSSKAYHLDTRQVEVGSQIKSQGDLSLQGNNIQIHGSQISSSEGLTALQAKEQLQIEEGRNKLDQQDQSSFSKKGKLSSSTTSDFSHRSSDIAVGSIVEGKKVLLDAGNINVRGSNIVSDELTQIQAKDNANIEGAQNQYNSQTNSVVKNSGVMSTGGIGFSLGKKQETTLKTEQQLTNSASQVGSLNGNTNIVAGKAYQQTGSTVSSQKGDVNILAQQVNIEAAKEQSTSDYKHEMQQKGLTLAVNVPVVSAVQSVVESAKQVGQSKNDRVNAMAAANAGFDAYKAGQSLSQLKDVASAAQMAQSANVSVSITYGEQKNTETSHSQSTTASQSQVNAGGRTSIVATGAGDQSNINIIGSDVLGQQGTRLAADNNVNIKAAEQNHLEESKNESAGWNAGVAVSYGSNGLAFGVTAGGNVGKGKGDGSETSYLTSHVGSKDSLTTISSGNATNIIGGQVQGKGVQIEADNLNVESLQNKADYKSKQQNVSGQATVGYGASVSGSFSKSDVKAHYASVQDQAGIYAGDDGYQIKVNKNTDLKGAIITSTQTAENLKKNSLDTGTLTSSNIQNVTEYDAKGISVDGGFNAGKSGTAGNKEPGTVLSTPNKIDQHASTTVGVSKSVGFGLDGDKGSSVTKSGINTQNITIRDEQGQQALTGKTAGEIKSEILTSVTTDTARENSGALQNNFDKDKVQSEINLQMDVTKNFDANRQEAKAEINKKIDDAKKENQSIIDKQKQGLGLSKQEQDQLNAYNDKVENYQRLGVLLDSISTGLSAPTSSSLGIATATLSPAVSYKIGQYFKEQASNNANGQLTSGQEAAHILAHTVLGAAVAAAGGNNALTAGLSAGGAEAAAPILSSFLYGKDAKELTADQKSTISSIVGLAGSAVGATTGDIGSIVQSGQVAQNAVENNFLSVKEAARKNALIYKSKHEELSSNEKKELAEINRKDKARDEFIKNVCQLGNVSSSACQRALQAAWSTQADYNADIANNLKNRDVYSQDAKHLDQLLKGLSQDQVLGLQAIERIAKTSGRPVEEVAKEYDRAMALHGVVSTLAGFYGGKAISVEKVKNGGGSFNALTEAEKQRVLDNIANSKAGRESSNFNDFNQKAKSEAKTYKKETETTVNANISEDKNALTPIGREGSPLSVPRGTNSSSTINGNTYSGHALDEMQADGIMSSVVDNTLKTITPVKGKVPGTVAYLDPVNNITVIRSTTTGKIITVSRGQIRQ
ncbi:hemagglutinin repeat-containing protein [Acinetobacter baumannii]|uniref:two-partner secretion domain-containing protein n=3 Tax=Acinetobacter baumannii TaxID=470 RepID=UPI0009CAD446|nr:hemagglutinin repeat-containing protein [Acinetobacter baumannii]MCA4174544.1 hemagglutinin repeat-containing protein [Acinetobacter baumannii]MCA4230507.1 hemagglutinin repeat-containing protein [Acinetobacter baumannii]MCF1268640.1 hemagglutinin repeat-containing protein [Acinetobacter baumannii]MCT6724863.1 hemagglutinin repeat-containing protein [Acinetobacter baumannii]MDF8285768.1 hemagglutinin repeat-containing protein [Acinetobacter baumannii]